tara:strand:- start:7678 stop:8787 length:1110 start_codon:yes stop_codon:yes gene_type:complete
MIPDTSPYYFNNSHQINSPSLLVYPSIIGDNIDNALKLISGENSFLYPHVKTIKSKEPLYMAMQRGIRSFKCSTIVEAELLGMVGAEHALICYQMTEDKMEPLAAMKSYYQATSFATVVDNFDSAKMLFDYFNGTSVEVYIDVDVGMNRTGLSINKVPDLVEKINQLKGLTIVGLHSYDGHVHDSDQELRKKDTEEIFQKLLELKDIVQASLSRKLHLVLGGSPSFPFYAKKSDVSCSPGTFFLWDYGYGKAFPELPFKPAALILTRIISKPTSRTLCFDLGYKAVASDPPQPRLFFADIPEYEILSQYEEHLVILVPDASIYKVGEKFLAIPFHICPTVNLYDQLAVIENQKFNGFWEVPARKRNTAI